MPRFLLAALAATALITACSTAATTTTATTTPVSTSADPVWNDQETSPGVVETQECSQALAVIRSQFDNTNVKLDETLKTQLREQLGPAYKACSQDAYRMFYQYELTPWLDKLQR